MNLKAMAKASIKAKRHGWDSSIVLQGGRILHTRWVPKLGQTLGITVDINGKLKTFRMPETVQGTV